MGADAEDVAADENMEGTGGQPVEEVPYEEPVRDNPRRNEELIAEAAAAGEIYDPAPPPEPSRAWEEEVQIANWETVVRIDAGATDDAVPGATNAGEPGDQVSSERRNRTEEVRDSEFARGWVRAKLLLEEELAKSEGDPPAVDPPVASDILEYMQSGDEIGDPGAADGASTNGQSEGGFAPVPVENGLVIMGTGLSEDGSGETPDAEIEDAEPVHAGDETEDGADYEPLDESAPRDEAAPASVENELQTGPAQDDSSRDASRTQKDESRRNGSARGVAAAQTRQQTAAADPDDAPEDPPDDPEPNDAGRRDRADRDSGAPDGWSDDRFYAGGSALNWSGDIGVAGTDDDTLYLTQRSGSGPGKRRGFDYTIPVEESGVYMVRLFFAEPYWGAPGGPEGDVGRRVFSVAAEGEIILQDLDVYAEAGALTALVKQVEVAVEDGELDLRFTATEGEPIVAAIEILTPAE
jgi:hypothetical protein